MDKNFESFLLKQYSENNLEVFSFIYNDEKYWLKRARKTKSTLFHKLAYFISKFEPLRPVEFKNEKETLDFETNKIETFAKKAILTPKIVYKCDKFFVLEDCGKMINSYIRKRDISKEEMYYYLDKAIETLAQIHNNNEYHGGAQARNFIYKNGKVTVIDLEDSFKDTTKLKLLQYRDFLLLLLSFTKTRASFELDYSYIIDKYIELTNNFEFKEQLKKLTKRLRFIIKLSEIKFIKKILGRDVVCFFKLFKNLKNI